MSCQKLRVAIVDDEEPVRKALHRLCSAADMSCASYATGAEYLAQCTTLHADCLLLDLHMPDMTGLEVLHRLSAAGMHIPAIVITAHDDAGSRERCLAAGAAAYLCKPLDGQVLLHTISEVVARAQAT